MGRQSVEMLVEDRPCFGRDSHIALQMHELVGRQTGADDVDAGVGAEAANEKRKISPKRTLFLLVPNAPEVRSGTNANNNPHSLTCNCDDRNCTAGGG